MIARALIERWAGRGVRVALEGVHVRYLVLGGQLDDAALAELRAQKPEILQALLSRMRDQRVGDVSPSAHWWPAAAREAFEERAAIIEHDGGVGRVLAEVLAEIGVRTRLAEGGAP